MIFKGLASNSKSHSNLLHWNEDGLQRSCQRLTVNNSRLKDIFAVKKGKLEICWNCPPKVLLSKIRVLLSYNVDLPIITGKVFKNGPNENYRRQPSKTLNNVVCLRRLYLLYSYIIKAVFRIFYLVHSWLLCLICHSGFSSMLVASLFQVKNGHQSC